MATFQDARAITKLCTVLETDEDPDVRYVAAESLGDIGDRSTFSVLDHASKYDTGVDYEGFAVSRAAQEALDRIRQRLG